MNKYIVSIYSELYKYTEYGYQFVKLLDEDKKIFDSEEDAKRFINDYILSCEMVGNNIHSEKLTLYEVDKNNNIIYEYPTYDYNYSKEEIEEKLGVKIVC